MLGQGVKLRKRLHLGTGLLHISTMSAQSHHGHESNVAGFRGDASSSAMENRMSKTVD